MDEAQNREKMAQLQSINYHNLKIHELYSKQDLLLVSLLLVCT